MYRIILIEKYMPSSLFWPNLSKNKKLDNLSVLEILDKYQGFEGNLIAFFLVSDKRYELENAIHKCLKVKKLNNHLLLHVVSNSNEMPITSDAKAVLVGYEVGVCEKEKTIYSSIFNEILFGKLDELTVYKDFLNENLLFPSRSLAEQYVKLHDQLSAQGMDVEDYEEMTIYEIWKQ